MVVIDKLVALLGYQLDDKSEQEKEKYTKGLDSIENVIINVGKVAQKTALGALALGAAFGTLATNTANSVDGLGKFADATGLSFEEIQKLTHAATIFGGSQDAVISSLDNIQQKLAEYRRGQGDFQLLGEIGVDIGGGVDALQFIDRLADRFQNLSRERAQELGRKLGLDRDFIQLLRQGSNGINTLRQEAVELGTVLDTDVAANSANLVDAQYRLHSVFKAVHTQVISGLMPVLTKLATRLTDFIKVNRKLIETNLKQFIEGLLVVLETMADIVLFIANGFKILSDTVGGVKNALIALVIGFIAFRIATSAALATTIAKMGLLGIATTAVNAKVLLIPALIAAAVALALIAIQDLYVFLKGGDSVIGRVVDNFVNFSQSIHDAGGAASELLRILERIGSLAALPGKVLGNTAGRIAVAIDQDKSLSDFALGISNDISNYAIDQGKGIYDFISSGLFGNTTTNNTSTQGNMQVEINVAPGQVQSAVAGAIEGANTIATKNGMNLTTTVLQ